MNTCGVVESSPRGPRSQVGWEEQVAEDALATAHAVTQLVGRMTSGDGAHRRGDDIV